MYFKIIFLMIVLGLPLQGWSRMNVVTTIPDLAAIAKEVGGDLVEVKSLARGDQDPHYLEPKPSYALLMNRADLFILVGLQLEVGWVPVLLTQSRNPNIQNGSPGHLNASEGVSIMEIPEGPIDRSLGDVHPEGNPHYWLDPRNGLIIGKNIMERLITLDPDGKNGYEQNFLAFQKRLTGKINEWVMKVARFKGQKVITHHKSFSYFVSWAGLNVMGFIEPKPGIPSPPGHVHSLIQLIKKEPISLILTENFYNAKYARQLAEKTGARALILPGMVGGEKGIETYADLFDHLIGQIDEAL